MGRAPKLSLHERGQTKALSTTDYTVKQIADVVKRSRKLIMNFGVAKVHQELRRLRPKLVNRKGPILLHDNDRPQVSQMTAEIKRTGLRNSTLSSSLTRPLSDRLPLFQASRQLLQEVFNNQAVAKNVFEEFIVSKILCCRSK
uniref:HTH_Tnp_Tc3_2 domain-containing protein n=1 Tax=Heterorhabditis bacteriophora TaxID=37862 RepID=A0A1I7XTZ3_HETBA